MLKVGDPAPDFDAVLDNGETVSLSQFKGKNVVLYFYPKDNTPGCTREACDFRDNISSLEDKNTVVLGVSPDSVKSHQKFKDKFELPFPLISDEAKDVAQAFGVWREKKMYGKTRMGIVRSTFIIGPDGLIAKAYDSVKVAGHVEDVIANL